MKRRKKKKERKEGKGKTPPNTFMATALAIWCKILYRYTL